MIEKESLEYVSIISKSWTQKDLLETIAYVDSLSTKYKKITHILKFKNCSTQFQNSLLQGIVLNKIDNVYHCLIGTPSELKALGIKNKDFFCFIKISSELDLDFIKEINKIYGIVIYITDKNYREIPQIYSLLQSFNLRIIDMFNIKPEVENFHFSNDIRLKLSDFFVNIIKKSYYFDSEREQVYNKETNLPIKSIRPLYKMFYKYTFSWAFLNVQELEKDKIISFLSNKVFTRKEFFDRELPSQDFVLRKIGFQCNQCDFCCLKGKCSSFSKEIYQIPEENFCELAKFSDWLFELVKKNYNKGLKSFFDIPENRRMA